MYPPASGAGADRRQDLQPEVFILQLVASSAWGMNEPTADSAPQGANMGKCRRPGVTRALLRASLGLQLANPGEEFRRSCVGASRASPSAPPARGPARLYSILLAILACRSSDHRSHRGRTTESNSPQQDE